LAALVVRAAGRKPLRWAGALAAAGLGVGSHLLLDWTNMYGLRPLVPFSAKWTELDLTSVVDLWIWAVLLLAVAGPFIGRLVGSEISSGSLKGRSHGRGFAIFALLFLLAYNCGRGVLHARAAGALDSRLYEESAPLRVAALPNPANPFRWRGVVETGGFYAVEDVDATGEFDPLRAAIFHKPAPDPAIDAARGAPVIREFLRFSQYPLWRITPAAEPENGALVEIFDLRFGTPQDPGFMASALLDSRLRVVKTSFQFGKLRVR
jgi:inner membrane protein